MCASEWTRLTGSGKPRDRIVSLAKRLVQQLPPFAGGPRRLGDRPAKLVELAGEVFQGRLEARAELAAMPGKEDVRRSRSCYGSHTAHHQDVRFFGHTGLLDN